MPALQLLHEDAYLLAVNKPAGVPVHRSRLVGRADAYLVDLLREQVGGRLFPAHRLDAATSGVLLVARDRDTAAALGEQFMARSPDKRYLAVVRGWPEPASGVIDYALPGSRPGSERRPARTDYRRLATVEVPIAISRYPQQRYALLEARPQSGRFRQIRKHFAHIHHPVIGDSQHGRSDHNRLFRQHLGCHRMLLHARRIRIEHPHSGAMLDIEAPLDAAWAQLLQRFAWDTAALADED